MIKGDLVRYSAILQSRKHREYPSNIRETRRVELDEEKRGVFLGFSKRLSGHSVYEGEDVGYVFLQTGSVRVAVVCELDGTVAWHQVVTVLPDDLTVEKDDVCDQRC